MLRTDDHHEKKVLQRAVLEPDDGQLRCLMVNHIATAQPKRPAYLHPRQQEIFQHYLREVEQHLDDLLQGRETRMFHIKDFADKLCIHPTHLSNTIYQISGESPCAHFERRIMDIARQLLRDTPDSIGDIALRLTFDPSNFTKFFKHHAGITPRQYRVQLAENLM